MMKPLEIKNDGVRMFVPHTSELSSLKLLYLLSRVWTLYLSHPLKKENDGIFYVPTFCYESDFLCEHSLIAFFNEMK